VKHADRLKKYDADVILLTEVSDGAPLFDRLKPEYPYQVTGGHSKPPRGAAILSRKPLEPGEERSSSLGARYVAATADSITFVSLYGPSNWRQRDALQAFWEAVVDRLSRKSGAEALVAGDFNLGLSKYDNQIGQTPAWRRCADPFYQSLCDIGFVDVWRALRPDGPSEYSYYPPGRKGKAPHGRRLDHAFATRSLAARVTYCRYDHTARERVGGKNESDHSALLLELH
jgi:exonuclease III